MKVKKLFALIFSIVMIASLFASCEKELTVVGTWKEIDSNTATYKFNSDGTLTIKAVGYTINANYEIKQLSQEEGNIDGQHYDDITITYKDITYKDENGKDVTKEFFYLYPEKEIVEREIESLFGNKPQIKKEIVVTGVETTLSEPLKGKISVQPQTGRGNMLVIRGDVEVQQFSEKGSKYTETETQTWKMEQTYEEQ